MRLREAALDLYEERGFDQVTTAEIAVRAGLTERTFYRHFADKREVLFDGEKTLREALVKAVAGAPGDLAPLPALLWSFRAAVPVVSGNRPFSERMRRVIAATPALRERAQGKSAALVEALEGALRDRGADASTASLAAEIAMAVFHRAAAVWFAHPERDLDEVVRETFGRLPALVVPLAG